MSETVKLGKVSMTLGGDYNSSQAYDKLTCVYYDGSSWVSRKAVPAGVAPTAVNSAYWQKVSDRGAQGPQGQSYVDKTLVPIVNDLTTGGSSNVLAAEQGKVLDTKLTELSADVSDISLELNGGTIEAEAVLPSKFESINYRPMAAREMYYEDGKVVYSCVTSATKINYLSTYVATSGAIDTDQGYWIEIGDGPILLKYKVDNRSNVPNVRGAIATYRDFGSTYQEVFFDIPEGESEGVIDVMQLLREAKPTSYHLDKFVSFNGIVSGESTNSVSINFRFEFFGFATEEDKVALGKQDLLVSGKNIKTINGESLLGEGNITIKVAEGNGNIQESAIAELDQIPDYYKTIPTNPTSYDDGNYINGNIGRVPKVGKKFVFFTDTHWDWNTNAKKSPLLISYVKKMLNIKNVIFGGDWLNRQDSKYGAKAHLADFAMYCKSAFKGEWLPIMGNHDINCTNLTAEDIAKIPVADRYLPCNISYDILFGWGKRTGDLWDRWADKMTQLANAASFSEDDIKDLEAECRMNYYYDDDEQKIRFIFTKPTTGYTKVATLFGSETRYTLEWFYETLLTTPEGYDVCYAAHQLSGYIHNGASTSVYEIHSGQAIMLSMMMGLKLRMERRTYISEGSANEKELYPYTTRVFDFTNAPIVGKVFCIAGDAHYDEWSLVKNGNSFLTLNATPYNGEVIDQSKVLEFNSCELPIIWTAADAFGQKDDERLQMELGTTTENLFDVITIGEKAINFTRFGAGNDRQVNFA